MNRRDGVTKGANMPLEGGGIAGAFHIYKRNVSPDDDVAKDLARDPNSATIASLVEHET